MHYLQINLSPNTSLSTYTKLCYDNAEGSPYLLQVVDVHELCPDGSAVDLLQALDDVPQRERLLLKVFRNKGFFLKEKREKKV